MQFTEAVPFTNIDDIQDHEVIILMGKTRAGKSTFINDLIGHGVMQSSSTLKSETSAMSYTTTTIDHQGLSRKIALVDTVGFAGSDTTTGKARALVDLASKLQSTREKPTVAGIIFLYAITDACMNVENQDSLQLFRDLVGDDGMDSVLFVTCQWCLPEEGARDSQEEHEEELKNVYWDALIEAGGRVERLDDQTSRLSQRKLASCDAAAAVHARAAYQNNTTRIVRLILEKPARQQLQLQREMQEVGPNGYLRQITVFQRVIAQLQRDIGDCKSLGADPSIMAGTAAVLDNVSVGALTKLAQRMNFVQGLCKKIIGDNEFGQNTAYVAALLGEAALAIAGLYVGDRSKQAVLEAYPVLSKAIAGFGNRLHASENVAVRGLRFLFEKLGAAAGWGFNLFGNLWQEHQEQNCQEDEAIP